MKYLAASLVIAGSLVGCASVPMSSPQQDAMLKTFAVAPGSAGIFIYRNEVAGVTTKMNVYLDGAPLGQTAAKTYLYREVAPGRHTVTSRAENTDTLDVHVEAGSLAFVWQEVKWGVFSPRNKLHLMHELEGKAGVLASRLAESKTPMQSVDVRVEADDPAWRGLLECQASNSFGNWPFVAPGSVAVATSTSALQIMCKPAADAAHGPGATVRGTTVASQDPVRKGASTGAKVGAGAGAALGVAAAPVMGPTFAVLMVVGGALRGAEVGGIVGAVTADDIVEYPSPIVIRIKRASSPD